MNEIARRLWAQCVGNSCQNVMVSNAGVDIFTLSFKNSVRTIRNLFNPQSHSYYNPK